MFIIEWIYEYINTPAMDMTAEIEMLYYLALFLILGIAAVIVWVGVLVGRFFGKLRKQKRRERE